MGAIFRIPPSDEDIALTSLNASALPTAVIIGGDVNGLGVARALAGQGVPVLILDTDLRRPTMQTRHGRKRALPGLAGDQLMQSLSGLRGQFSEKPVLFPTQESSVSTLSSRYSEIRDLFHLALPTDATVQAMLDKARFQPLAEQLGFAVPRSLFLIPATDRTALEQLRYPCVLKPTTKDTNYGRQFAKAYRVSGADEAAALWTRMKTVIDTAVIQEWVEGGDSDVYFCLQYRPPSGGAPTSFCGRKTLQWPLRVGGTASCIPAPEAADTLVPTTSSFFDRVGFVGLCSMEYKRDPRDQTFYMIEPTAGRTDYQEEIAALNGVNIPLAAYRDLTGASVGKVYRKTPQRGWRDPFGHHNAIAAGGHDPLFELRPDIRLVDAYFRLDDPMPYLAARMAPIRARFAGRGGRT